MNYAITQEESERMNILKFIAMVLVVFIHAQNVGVAGSDITQAVPRWVYVFENVISKDIAGMADGLFFLLSAILLFRSQRKYGAMLKKKFHSLVIPYVIWNSIWVALFLVFEKIPFTSAYFANPEYRVSSWGITDFLKYYGVSWSGYPLLYPLWFMRDIMVMMLISPILKWVCKRIPKVMLLFAFVGFFVPISVPFKGALLFFIIGACLVQLDIHMQALDCIPLSVTTLIYIILIVTKECTTNAVVSGMVNLWGILFFLKLSKNIYDSSFYQNRGWVKAIVSYSFAIYVGHEMFMTIFKKISAAVLPQNAWTVLGGYIVFPIILMLLCILIAAFVKRKLPHLYNVLTGSR